METVSFRSVFILLSVIFSYSGNGLVQCSVYIIIGYIQCYSETVSFSAVLVALKRAVGVSQQRRGLSALSADAARQLDVFGHDGDSLGVDGAQVGVLKQTDQISLAGLLQGHDSGALEAQVRLEILRDFSHQALERQFADQQLGGLLITADLSESHGPGPVTVGLLDAAGGWGALPGGFSSELLPRGFAAGGFTSRLLGSCHREDLTSFSDLST